MMKSLSELATIKDKKVDEEPQDNELANFNRFARKNSFSNNEVK